MPSMSKILITDQQIRERIGTLAAEIERDYPQGSEIHLVAVLKGGFMFMADLVRAMSTGVTTDFIAVSSYGKATSSSGQVMVLKDLESSIENRDVIIVEDIVDTGLTIAHLLDLLRTRKPASLKVCALLHKPSRTRVEVPVHYLGFTIEDKFVVGYGLDWAERYRNVPFIGVVEAA